MLTRRTALLGTFGGLGVLGSALSACDVDDLRPPDADAPVTPSASPGRPTADEALVEQAAAAIGSAVVVVAAARIVPGLRRPLTSLYRDHRRHLSALDDPRAGSPGPDVASGPADRASALAGVRTAEQTLRDQLVDFAASAESGTLAALLASMSASVAQHLATLDAV